MPACLAKVLALTIGFRAMSVNYKCLFKVVLSKNNLGLYKQSVFQKADPSGQLSPIAIADLCRHFAF